MDYYFFLVTLPVNLLTSFITSQLWIEHGSVSTKSDLRLFFLHNLPHTFICYRYH